MKTLLLLIILFSIGFCLPLVSEDELQNAKSEQEEIESTYPDEHIPKYDEHKYYRSYFDTRFGKDKNHRPKKDVLEQRCLDDLEFCAALKPAFPEHFLKIAYILKECASPDSLPRIENLINIFWIMITDPEEFADLSNKKKSMVSQKDATINLYEAIRKELTDRWVCLAKNKYDKDTFRNILLSTLRKNRELKLSHESEEYANAFDVYEDTIRNDIVKIIRDGQYADDASVQSLPTHLFRIISLPKQETVEFMNSKNELISQCAKEYYLNAFKNDEDVQKNIIEDLKSNNEQKIYMAVEWIRKNLDNQNILLERRNNSFNEFNIYWTNIEKDYENDKYFLNRSKKDSLIEISSLLWKFIEVNPPRYMKNKIDDLKFHVEWFEKYYKIPDLREKDINTWKDSIEKYKLILREWKEEAKKAENYK